jgi:hypothetical protein
LRKNSLWTKNPTTGAEAHDDFLGLYAALKRRSSTFRCSYDPALNKIDALLTLTDL